MSFDEAIAEVANKVREQREAIQTEEATKNAFVMPFISRVLGYDVFNPLEVIPEYTADIGTKRGEKVDYAIMHSNEVQILIECKRVGDPLNINHASQLFRYFHTTNARIGVLTNGQIYNFYTDLDKPNKMDERPFLVLDLLEIDESSLPELEKLTKETFDLNSILTSAEELKYVGALKRQIAEEFKDPSPEFVKLLMGRVSERRATVDNLRQFTSLTEKATKNYLKEQVNVRLKSALNDPDPVRQDYVPEGVETPGTPLTQDYAELVEVPDVVTTEEELAGYQIVKAIACSEVEPQRITQRDSKTYMAILLDNNNRRMIARLWFNGKTKRYIGVFDENKVETKHEVVGLDEIYKYANDIRAAVKRHVGGFEG